MQQTSQQFLVSALAIINKARVENNQINDSLMHVVGWSYQTADCAREKLKTGMILLQVKDPTEKKIPHPWR